MSDPSNTDGLSALIIRLRKRNSNSHLEFISLAETKIKTKKTKICYF